jgi:hypothetical protein
MVGQGNPVTALAVCQQSRAPAAVIEHLKTAVAGLDLSESIGWAPMVAGFLTSLVAGLDL